ncbi:hypothetical protein QQ045_021471 [Rhodiola kirilowii]
MEGLIPFVYKTIIQYKNGNGVMVLGNESPSYSYVKLRGDSGRFHSSDFQVFQSDCAFTATNSNQRGGYSASSVSVGQSPRRHGTAARRVMK